MNDASHSVEFQAADGMPLRGRVFEPSRPALFTALVLPGVGVPQRAFRHLAAWMAERGVRCLTVDYRGIGESATGPESWRTATLLTWARLDAVAALEYAESQWPEPVALVAHSFGGQLIGLAEPMRRAAAAVLVTSQIGHSRYWDGTGRWLLEFYWRAVLPLGVAIYERLPAAVGFGTRLPRGVAEEWARWGRSPDWFFSWEPSATDVFAAFDRPLLVFSVSDDAIAPPRAVEALLSYFSSTTIERRHLEPADIGVDEIGHVGFFKPGAIENEWQRALTFLQNHASA